MSILTADGTPVQSDPIVQQFTQVQWDYIRDHLRQLDLFRIVLAALAKNEGGKLVISDHKLAEIERSGKYGLSFHHNDSRQCMIFEAVDVSNQVIDADIPLTGNETVN